MEAELVDGFEGVEESHLMRIGLRQFHDVFLASPNQSGRQSHEIRKDRIQSGYGSQVHTPIKQFQDVWLNSNYKATCINGGLGDPDFLKIANAYEMKACQINNQRELRDKIKEVLNFPGPILCSVELRCGEKIKPKLEFGKPIEDPAPLLDREEFKKNMIIPLLDDSIKSPQLAGH